jgi:hypothetical protein
MLFSCYLLQFDFKGATPLAPTALPLWLRVHARQPRRGSHAAPRIARARRDGSSSVFAVERVRTVQMPVPTCGSALMVRYRRVLARSCGACTRAAWGTSVITGSSFEPAVVINSRQRRFAEFNSLTKICDLRRGVT